GGSSVALTGGAEEHLIVLRVVIAVGTRAAIGIVVRLVTGVHPALLAVRPQEHLLGERDLAAEQGADRLAAMDPLDGLADEWGDGQGRDLREPLDRRQRDRGGADHLGGGGV